MAVHRPLLPTPGGLAANLLTGSANLTRPAVATKGRRMMSYSLGLTALTTRSPAAEGSALINNQYSSPRPVIGFVVIPGKALTTKNATKKIHFLSADRPQRAPVEAPAVCRY